MGSELTFVVEHDSQDRDAVSCRDPVHATGHAEQESAVADNGADELGTAAGLESESDAERGTAAPSQSCAAAIEPSAWDRGLKLVGDLDGAGDGFDDEDGVGWDRGFDRGADVIGCDCAVVAWSCEFGEGGTAGGVLVG